MRRFSSANVNIARMRIKDVYEVSWVSDGQPRTLHLNTWTEVEKVESALADQGVDSVRVERVRFHLGN